jgi:chemotaxis protein methyltransferase CheR
MRRMLNELTGITLQERGREMIYNRLGRRLRQLKLDGFAAYIQLVEKDSEEARTFAEALTTNTTHFFREEHHFDYVSDVLVPDWLKNRSQDKRVRIWSAACSSGEEPYTLAMVLQESRLRSAGFDTRILATDIDRATLEKARMGTYPAEGMGTVTPERMKRWFKRGVGTRAGQARVAPELKQMITFNPLNLMNPWPVKGPFDLILCRNVFIYFSPEVTADLTLRFSEVLRPGGILMLGHSESMVAGSTRFDSVGKTIYRRRAS